MFTQVQYCSLYATTVHAGPAVMKVKPLFVSLIDNG
jgi:hypothetical protein